MDISAAGELLDFGNIINHESLDIESHQGWVIAMKNFGSRVTYEKRIHDFVMFLILLTQQIYNC